MRRSTVVIELASDATLSRDLAAGGVFVPGCTLRMAEECDLIVCGATRRVSLPARVVYRDGHRGAGLELIGFSTAIREELADLTPIPPIVNRRAATAEIIRRAPTANPAPPAPPPPPPAAAPAPAPEDDDDLALPIEPADAPEGRSEITGSGVSRRTGSEVTGSGVYRRSGSEVVGGKLARGTRDPVGSDPAIPLSEAEERERTATGERRIERAVARTGTAERAQVPSRATTDPIHGSRDFQVETVESPSMYAGGTENDGEPWPSEDASPGEHDARPRRISAIHEIVAADELYISAIDETGTAHEVHITAIDEIDDADASEAGAPEPNAASIPGTPNTETAAAAGDPAADDEMEEPAEVTDTGLRHALRTPRNVHERLRGLTLAAQIKLATSGELHERIVLERLYGKNVWETLLRNPRLTAPEVARIARYGSLPRILLEIILANNTWLQIPEVRRALLSNPRLGTDQIIKVLRLVPKHELRLAAIQTAYPHAVRNAAKMLMRGE